MTNEKRIRSFSATPEVDDIMDDLAWGERSKFINRAVQRYVTDGAKADEAKAEKKDGSGKASENSEPQSSSKGSSLTQPKPSDAAASITNENSPASAQRTQNIIELIESLRSSEEPQ